MRRPSLQTIGLISVAILTVLTLAVDFHDDHATKPPPAPLPHAADTLRAELLRCQLLGKAALDDATCTAAWAGNRRRFFGSQLGTTTQHNTVAKEKAKNP
jgi:conjugative transfer region protein TrbK